jgi:hypothetical protein
MPLELPGPHHKGQESEGLAEAIRLFALGRRGKPDEADRPSPSTFPMTKAARAALHYKRQEELREKAAKREKEKIAKAAQRALKKK